MSFFDDDPSVLDDFVAEAEELLRNLEQGLLHLESNPHDTEALDLVFRAVHTIKGGASILGFDGLTEYAHVYETLLDVMRAGEMEPDSELVTILLGGSDNLTRLVQRSVAGDIDLDEASEEHLSALSIMIPEEFGDGGASTQTALPSFGLVNAAEFKQISSEVKSSTATARPERKEKDATVRSGSGQTLRVALSRLDRIMTLVSEIAISRGRVTEMLSRDVNYSRAAILESHQQADHLYLELQEQVMRVRMVPLGPTFERYIRVVRDVAIENGKLATLEIEGGDVEVDTRVIEQIKDPLTHMIRNAIDHGIEFPSERIAAGKDATGKLKLSAYHSSGVVHIQLEDDGKGLNRDRIVERAISRGVDARDYTDRQVFQMIFEAGFSTAEAVTDLSGRGVGMDVVQRNIESLRGSISVDSVQGEGTTFTARVPLTLAIIEGFLARVGDETVVVPLDVVEECREFQLGEMDSEATEGVIEHRGEPLPFLRLREFFHLRERNRITRESALLVRMNDRRAALIVDDLIGAQQVVIKPLDKLFRGLPGIQASTILGDGRVALILDVAALVAVTARHHVDDVDGAEPTTSLSNQRG